MQGTAASWDSLHNTTVPCVLDFAKDVRSLNLASSPKAVVRANSSQAWAYPPQLRVTKLVGFQLHNSGGQSHMPSLHILTPGIYKEVALCVSYGVLGTPFRLDYKGNGCLWVRRP